MDDKSLLGPGSDAETTEEQTVAQMALKTPDDRDAALKSFAAELREKVDWIERKCYEDNLLIALGGLAEILTAGFELGLSGDSKTYLQGISHPLYKTLHPLVVIKARKQIHSRLLEFLEARGVDMAIF